MITFKRCYITSAGSACASIEEAQQAELCLLFGSTGAGNECAELVVKHKEEVLNILTTTEKSRPRARAVNGAKRGRKIVPATLGRAAAAPQPEPPLAA